VGRDVFYDDIEVVPIPYSCSNLVSNSDFETGDSRFWDISCRSCIDYDMFAQGADGSSYSLMTKKYSGHRIYQDLDTRCIIENQEFAITAKFRLLNATDLSGMTCAPSSKNRNDPTHCPTVAIYGEKCVGNNIRFYFFNEKDQLDWDPNSFNEYEKVFPVTGDLASCDVSLIFLK